MDPQGAVVVVSPTRLCLARRASKNRMTTDAFKTFLAEEQAVKGGEVDKTLIDEEVLIEVPIQTPIEVEFSEEGATAADPIDVPLEVMLWPPRKSPIRYSGTVG